MYYNLVFCFLLQHKVSQNTLENHRNISLTSEDREPKTFCFFYFRLCEIVEYYDTSGILGQIYWSDIISAAEQNIIEVFSSWVIKHVEQWSCLPNWDVWYLDCSVLLANSMGQREFYFYKASVQWKLGLNHERIFSRHKNKYAETKQWAQLICKCLQDWKGKLTRHDFESVIHFWCQSD